MRTHYNLKVTNKPPRKAKANYIQALLILATITLVISAAITGSQHELTRGYITAVASMIYRR